MVFSKIARISREVQVPLDSFKLDLIHQDLDQVYLLLSNGLTSEYIRGTLTSDYLSGSIEPEAEYLIGTVIGPT
jgi:hypothetical protein